MRTRWNNLIFLKTEHCKADGSVPKLTDLSSWESPRQVASEDLPRVCSSNVLTQHANNQATAGHSLSAMKTKRCVLKYSPVTWHGVCSSSVLGPVDPSFRARSGRLKFLVRRHKFNKDSLLLDTGCDSLLATLSREPKRNFASKLTDLYHDPKLSPCE